MFIEKIPLMEHYSTSLSVKMDYKIKLWNEMGSTTLFILNVMQQDFHDMSIIWLTNTLNRWSASRGSVFCKFLPKSQSLKAAK